LSGKNNLGEASHHGRRHHYLQREPRNVERRLQRCGRKMAGKGNIKTNANYLLWKGKG